MVEITVFEVHLPELPFAGRSEPSEGTEVDESGGTAGRALLALLLLVGLAALARSLGRGRERAEADEVPAE